MVKAQNLCILFGPLSWIQTKKSRLLSSCSAILPMMSAVSFLRINTCILMNAALSVSKEWQDLGHFLVNVPVIMQMKCNFVARSYYQTSTLLWRRLLCWKMLGRSQPPARTLTSSHSMPKLALILSRLSVFKVAELSM